SSDMLPPMVLKSCLISGISLCRCSFAVALIAERTREDDGKCSRTFILFPHCFAVPVSMQNCISSTIPSLSKPVIGYISFVTRFTKHLVSCSFRCFVEPRLKLLKRATLRFAADGDEDLLTCGIPGMTAEDDASMPRLLAS